MENKSMILYKNKQQRNLENSTKYTFLNLLLLYKTK